MRLENPKLPPRQHRCHVLSSTSFYIPIYRKSSLEMVVHKHLSSSASGERDFDDDERHQRASCSQSPSHIDMNTREDEKEQQTQEEQGWGFTPRTTNPRSSRGLRRTLNRLRRHPRVESLLDYFITVSTNGSSSDVNVGITREHFLNVYIRCYKATMPDIDVGLAEKMAYAQWNHGGFRSSKTISRPEFMNKLFELINNCTHTLDVKEYVLFASLLFERIIQTVKHGDTLQHQWRDMADISAVREGEHFSFKHDPERFTPFPHPNVVVETRGNTDNFPGFKGSEESSQTFDSVFREATRVRPNITRRSDTTKQIAKRKKESGNTNPKPVSAPSVLRGFMKMTESRKLRHRNPVSAQRQDGPTKSSITQNRQKTQRSQSSSVASSVQQTAALLHGSNEAGTSDTTGKSSDTINCCLAVKRQSVPVEHSAVKQVNSSNQGTHKMEAATILPEEVVPPMRSNTDTTPLDEGNALIRDVHDRAQQKVSTENHSQQELNNVVEKQLSKTDTDVVSSKKNCNRDEENTKDFVLEQNLRPSTLSSRVELQKFHPSIQESVVVEINSDTQRDKASTRARKHYDRQKHKSIFTRKKCSGTNRLDRSEQESAASCAKSSRTRNLSRKQELTSVCGGDESTKRNGQTSMDSDEKMNQTDFDFRENSCTVAVSVRSESWNHTMLPPEKPQRQTSVVNHHRYRDFSSVEVQPIPQTPLNYNRSHEGSSSMDDGDCKSQPSAQEQGFVQASKLLSKKKAGSRKDKDSKRKVKKDKARHTKERITCTVPSAIEASDKTNEVNTGDRVVLSPEKDKEGEAESATSRNTKSNKNSSKRALSKNKAAKKGVRLRPKTRPHGSNAARKAATVRTNTTSDSKVDIEQFNRGLQMITIRKKDPSGEDASAWEISASVCSQSPPSVSSINWVVLNRKLSDTRSQSTSRDLTWPRLMPRCLLDIPLLALDSISRS